MVASLLEEDGRTSTSGQKLDRILGLVETLRTRGVSVRHVLHDVTGWHVDYTRA